MAGRSDRLTRMSTSAPAGSGSVGREALRNMYAMPARSRASNAVRMAREVRGPSAWSGDVETLTLVDRVMDQGPIRAVEATTSSKTTS